MTKKEKRVGAADISILAAADLHLGMKFAGYPEVQEELSGARFEALDTIVALANNRSADLLIMAGDLFDRLKMTKKDILRAAAGLNRFEGKVCALLPGNHDFMSGRDSLLWSVFMQEAGDRVLVLKERKTYPLGHYDIPAVLFPGPCDAAHSPHHRVSWISNEREDDPENLHIGIVHGSIRGISPDVDDRYFPMELAELQRFPVDLWIAGHTHIPQDHRLQKSHLFIPGTPEPDGFDCETPGQVWMIRCTGKKVTGFEMLETGAYRFAHRELEVSTPGDLETLEADRSRDDPARTLLKLSLRGVLPGEDLAAVKRGTETLRKRFFYAEIDDTALRQKITAETIDREFPAGSFPHRLLTELTRRKQEKALQTAYDILREVRQ